MVVKTKNVIKSMKKRKSINKNKRKSKKKNMKGGNKFNISSPPKVNSGYTPKNKFTAGDVFSTASLTRSSHIHSLNSLRRKPKVEIPKGIESNLGKPLNVSNSGTLNRFAMRGSTGSRGSLVSTGSDYSRDSGYSGYNSSSGSEPSSPTREIPPVKQPLVSSVTPREKQFIANLTLKRRQNEEKKRIQEENKLIKEQNPAYRDPRYQSGSLDENARPTYAKEFNASRRGTIYDTPPNFYAPILTQAEIDEQKLTTLKPLKPLK